MTKRDAVSRKLSHTTKRRKRIVRDDDAADDTPAARTPKQRQPRIVEEQRGEPAADRTRRQRRIIEVPQDSCTDSGPRPRETQSHTTDRNHTDHTDSQSLPEQRSYDGKFAPGNKIAVGNKGSSARGILTEALRRAVTVEDAEIILRRAVKQARDGSQIARSWLADRIIGRSRLESDDELLGVELPELTDLRSCSDAMSRVIRAAAEGQVTLQQAQRAASLIEAARASFEVVELQQRVSALEAARGLQAHLSGDHHEHDDHDSEE